MKTYRVTEFTSPVPEKIVEACESIKALVATAGADRINVADLGEGKGLVIARYASQEKMETATSVNQAAFGELIKAGVIDASSIKGRSGDLVFTF
jgi:predicted transcriptional regulator